MSCDVQVMEEKRGQFTIVPVLVGALDEGKEAQYGKLFSQYLADPHNLFVISSDFCHWGEHYALAGAVRHSHPLQAVVSATLTTIRQTVLSTPPLRNWTEL